MLPALPLCYPNVRLRLPGSHPCARVSSSSFKRTPFVHVEAGEATLTGILKAFKKATIELTTESL